MLYLIQMIEDKQKKSWLIGMIFTIFKFQIFPNKTWPTMKIVNNNIYIILIMPNIWLWKAGHELADD